MQSKNQNTVKNEAAPQKKKPYESSPQLITYGNIDKITQTTKVAGAKDSSMS